jgi:hypothetical protein
MATTQRLQQTANEEASERSMVENLRAGTATATAAPLTDSYW